MKVGLPATTVIAKNTLGGPMVDDIRGTDADQYWEELRQRWGALLSYRYIGRKFATMNSGVTDETVRLRRDMRNSLGGIMAAPLAITCPGGGGPSDLEAVPNPVIHSLQILDDASGVERIEVIDTELLKAGTRLYFGRAKIVDALNHERVIALVESQGAAIGVVPEGMSTFEDDADLGIIDAPDLPPLWQVFGGTHLPDGSWTLPMLSPELASPDAALHIGPQQVILEAAAMDLVEQCAGTTRFQVESWHVMFLARGKVGPFRTKGSATLNADGTKVAVQLTLIDEGEPGRNVTAAAGLFCVKTP